MPESKRKTQVKKLASDVDPEVIFYRDLVYAIRDPKKSNDEHNAAYELILEKLDPKIKKIVGKFKIAGYSFDDIHQEALIALQVKAIKDYNEYRGLDPTRPAPFDRFALLCIRRHLATTLKTSKQNRHSALNLSKSLDAERGSENDDLSLINIVCTSKENVVENIQERELFKILMKRLLHKLSSFEKQVLKLYISQYSYEEIAKIIKKETGKKVKIKSVDNALSRIKVKSKPIYDAVVKRHEK